MTPSDVLLIVALTSGGVIPAAFLAARFGADRAIERHWRMYEARLRTQRETLDSHGRELAYHEGLITGIFGHLGKPVPARPPREAHHVDPLHLPDHG